MIKRKKVDTFKKFTNINLEKIDDLKNRIIYLKKEHQQNQYEDFIKTLERKRYKLMKEKKVNDEKIKKMFDSLKKRVKS